MTNKQAKPFQAKKRRATIWEGLGVQKESMVYLAKDVLAERAEHKREVEKLKGELSELFNANQDDCKEKQDWRLRAKEAERELKKTQSYFDDCHKAHLKAEKKLAEYEGYYGRYTQMEERAERAEQKVKDLDGLELFALKERMERAEARVKELEAKLKAKT